MTLSALCALFPRIFGTRHRDATTYFTSLFGYPHLMRGEHIIGYALIAEWWYTKSERAQLCSIVSLRLCQAKNHPCYEFLLVEIYDPEQGCVVGYIDLEHRWTAVDSPASVHEHVDENKPRSFGFASYFTSTAYSSTSTSASAFVSCNPRVKPVFETQIVLLDGSRFNRIHRSNVAYEELASVSLAPGAVPLRNFILAWGLVFEHQRHFGLLYHHRFWFSLVVLRLLVGSDLWESQKADLIGRACAATDGGKVSLGDVERTAQLLAAKYDEGTEALKTPRPIDDIGQEVFANYMPLLSEEQFMLPRARGKPVVADRPAGEQATKPAGESAKRVMKSTEKDQEIALLKEKIALLRLQLALRGIPFDEGPANEPSQNAAKEPSQNAAGEPTEDAGSALGDDAAKEPGECTRSSVRLCESDQSPHASPFYCSTC